MILKTKTKKKIFFISQFLVTLAVVFVLLALLDIGPIHLSLYLVLGQPFIILGVALFLLVAILEIFSHFGAKKIHFSPGEIVFKKGEPGDFVYTIINGEVEVISDDLNGEETVLARLGPGEYFGELALLSDEPRKATVKAVSPVDAMTLSRGDFKSLYTYMPELKKNINQVVERRTS